MAPQFRVDRRLEQVVLDAMQVEPVVVLHGPRTVGKSTLLAQVATACGRGVIDLDNTETRALVAAGTGFAVRGDGPVFIDEYQQVPEVLDSIKAELNRDFRAGRFVLTGSTSYTTLPRAAQSLTGRARVITIPPLSQHELAGPMAGATFLDQLLEDPAAAVLNRPGQTERLEYAARALAGGFPIPLRRAAPSRGLWFANYLNQVIERDVLDIRRIQQRDALPRLLKRLAAQTGQLINIARAAEAELLEHSTASDYMQLLEAVFLIRRLPAWGTTLGSRVNKLPKVHLMDTGVGGWLLGLSTERIARRDPSALTELGHLLETFTINEILAQVEWRQDVVEAGHYRTHDDHEVDLILQLSGGYIVAIEVKAGERVSKADIAQLTRLRNRVGDRFLGGVVLHTGLMFGTLSDRVHAAPIDRLWTLPN